MISYKELRIDNFVKRNDMDGIFSIRALCKDQVHPISLIDHDFAKNVHYGCECTLSELEPIPLSEEWLTKFGFVESNSYNKKERHFKKDGFNQLADYGGQLIILPEGGFAYLSCGYYENQIDCPYVHILQNLYYAIVGEELEVHNLKYS